MPTPAAKKKQPAKAAAVKPLLYNTSSIIKGVADKYKEATATKKKKK